MSIELRPVQGFREFRACEELQRETWGPFGIVPDHLLLTIQKSGGLVLGAYDSAAPAEPLVGFVFGFLGHDERGPKHASHMAAVSPAYRDRGIGEALKWGQRRHVLAQGLSRITWTYDPLISRNARLNVAKLGATCRTYLVNHYGPEPEGADGKLPSDRFQVDWWLESPEVVARVNGSYRAPDAVALRAQTPLANPDPQQAAVLPSDGSALLQIPADIDTLKAADMPRARAWRYQLRALALAAFNNGLAVTAYARDGDMGLYLLS